MPQHSIDFSIESKMLLPQRSRKYISYIWIDDKIRIWHMWPGLNYVLVRSDHSPKTTADHWVSPDCIIYVFINKPTLIPVTHGPVCSLDSCFMYEPSAVCLPQVTAPYSDMPTAQTDCPALQPYCINTLCIFMVTTPAAHHLLPPLPHSRYMKDFSM